MLASMALVGREVLDLSDGVFAEQLDSVVLTLVGVISFVILEVSEST